MNAQVIEMWQFPDVHMSTAAWVWEVRGLECGTAGRPSLADEAGSWMMGVHAGPCGGGGGLGEEGSVGGGGGRGSPICENLEVVHFPRIFSDEAMEPVPRERSLRHRSNQIRPPRLPRSVSCRPSVIPHTAAAIHHNMYIAK